MSASLLARIAEARLRITAATLRLALKHAHWRTQPRVPAGNPDGGRWTREGGGGAIDDGVARLVQAEAGQGFSVDLLEEEAAGGHAINRHVGRSRSSLLEYVRRHQYRSLFIRHGVRRHGSFPSVDAANKLVNSTLSRNRLIVDKVANGELANALVSSVFRSRTGIEAYTDGYVQPYLRDTYGVGVVIVHDPTRSRGYRVITAYPRNE